MVSKKVLHNTRLAVSAAFADINTADPAYSRSFATQIRADHIAAQKSAFAFSNDGASKNITASGQNNRSSSITQKAVLPSTPRVVKAIAWKIRGDTAQT